MKQNLLKIVVAGLLLVIFVCLLFVFQVRQSEVVVITRFGAVVREAALPGPYLKWPWPVEMVNRFDQRVQNFEEDRFTEMQTADSFNILTMVYVGWRISDPKAFLPRFPGGPAAAENTLRGLVSNAKGGVIGKHPLADLVNADVQRLKFDQIEQEIKAGVEQQVATNNYGIQIEFLGLKKIGLQDSVTSAVFDRMKAEREKLASKSQSEGQSEAQKIRSTAERRAAEMLASADGAAKEIRGQGEAEAAKSLAVFNQDPKLAGFLFRIDALESVLKDRATLIFDQRTPPFDVFLDTLSATNSPQR